MGMPTRPIGDGAEFSQVLAQARESSRDALGRLWRHCQEYLLFVARKNIHPQLAGKVSPSDIVQETFLEAQRDFAGFRGEREEELRAWLARILMNNLVNASRRFTETEMRAVQREVPLPALSLDATADNLAGDSGTASAKAMAREKAEQVHQALLRLPEHYRTVLQLRYERGLTFEQIALLVDRSAEATRKLWVRALGRLEQELVHHDVS
jgi:RNA polymerase sigma-70 factor (ECF subfamily)